MKKTLQFDFEKGDFVIENKKFNILSKSDALRMWIRKILHTQKFCCKAYKGTAYGIRTDDLVVGKSYGIGFQESELKREVEEALLANDDILSVQSFSVDRKKDRLNITIVLNTVYGAISEGVTMAA